VSSDSNTDVNPNIQCSHTYNAVTHFSTAMLKTAQVSSNLANSLLLHELRRQASRAHRSLKYLRKLAICVRLCAQGRRQTTAQADLLVFAPAQ